MGALRNNVCNIGSDERGQPPERVDCENFTPSPVRTLGVQPVLGRTLADDENPVDTTARVLLISSGFWHRRFNGDRNVLGQTLRVDGMDKTIIGVMPADFYLFDEQADFWTPVNWTRTEMQSTQYGMGVAARLRKRACRSSRRRLKWTAWPRSKPPWIKGPTANLAPLCKPSPSPCTVNCDRRCCCFKVQSRSCC